MRAWLGALVALVLPLVAAAQAVPEVDVGRIERLPALASKHVDARPVDVWLPADYSPARRYNVLYVHDGQMLFDAGKSWNGQAWDLQLTVARLAAAGRIPDTLIVGIWNNGPWRHSEYFPQKFLPRLPATVRERLVAEGLKGKPQSDAYLRFLVEELKPAIDARYPTRPGREHTFILGSSMGGLISVYAMNEYPQVFGGAAGLSTHWIGIFQANAEIPAAGLAYLREHLADPASHRLYQDHGSTELDALYAPAQRLVNEQVRARGYTEQGPEANFMTRVFDGSGHNERAWAARVQEPLVFLMAPR